MSYQIKFLNWPETGNHVIAINWGAMDKSGFTDLFDRLGELVQPLASCKVLIDLQDAVYELPEPELEIILKQSRPELWPADIKIGIVACPTTAEPEQLSRLSTHLSAYGFKVGVFYVTSDAIDWLSETTLCPS